MKTPQSTSIDARAHPALELLARYKAIVGAAWQARRELAGPTRLSDEAAFLPAALSLQATPVPAAQVLGRLNGDRSAWSGRLQRLPTHSSARRRTRLQTQVREDLLDDRLLQDRGDDLQLATAVRAVLEVERKDALISVALERCGNVGATSRA